jgi:hypothetical protein
MIDLRSGRHPPLVGRPTTTHSYKLAEKHLFL